MGNVLPLPCTCKEGMVVHATVAVKAKRKKPLVANNGSGGRADQDGGNEKEASWPGCRVEELAAGEDGRVRLKVVMTRKDAAEFMARLEKRAAERKARMEELVNGGVMSPCRDAWRPRLATIPEN